VTAASTARPVTREHMMTLMTGDQVAADPAGWHAYRRAGITASEIAAVMGIPTAYGTPSTVFWGKVDPEPPGDSIRFRVGHHMEPFIESELARDDPGLHLFGGGLWASTARPWMMATFDRLGTRCSDVAASVISGGCGHVMPVQMKTANARTGEGWRWGEPPDGEIPGHYLAQVAWEMAVSGAAEAVLPCLVMPGGPLLVYRVVRDDELEADIAAMIHAAEDMLRRVAAYDPPPVDWRPETTDALRRVFRNVTEEQVRIPRELARRYRAAKRAAKLAGQRVGLAENEIRHKLGNAAAAVIPGAEGEPPEVIARRSVYRPRRVDLELLRRDHAEIAAACTVEGRQVDKLLLK
jgi:putative phage-type endonuclease